MKFSLSNFIKGLLFTFFFLSSRISITQIIAPPPPEISNGAQAALETARFTQPIIPAEIPKPLVSNASPAFDAINFTLDGNNNGGFLSIPPDPCGAAGPNHVVNVVNRSIEWYTKAGVQNNSQSLKSFFNSPTTTFDPKVIYDQYEDRFVVVTLEVEGTDDGMTGTDKSRIYIAVSKTSDPNAGWWKSSINSLTSISLNNTWADYPGFAVDEEAVYVCANMFAHEGQPFAGPTAFGGIRLWIIPKGVIGGFYGGGSLGESIYNPYAGGGIVVTTQPAHTYGSMPAGVGTYLMGYGGLSNMTGTDFVQWVRVDNPLGVPTFTTNFVSLGDIENTTLAIPDAPQMGSDSLIDAGDRRALNAVWRNGRISMCFTYLGSGPDAGQATAYWVILNDNSGGIPTLNNQGKVGGEDIETGTHTYYPSIAMNSNEDLAIGFAASGPSIYAGAYYTGRESIDAAGSTDPVKTLRAGVDWYLRKFSGTRNRWGDYTATVVDPSNDFSFWVYNQYAITRGTPTMMPNEDGRWGTAFGKFTVSNCLANNTLAGIIPAGSYPVSNILTINGTINAPSLVMGTAGTAINLNPGFTLNSGATFIAAIAGCP